MGNINNLIIFTESRELIRITQRITADISFGDLSNQMRRAALSVACNICEGAGSGSDKQFARYLSIARASVNELQGQLLIASDLGYLKDDGAAAERADRLGRQLTCFIRRLRCRHRYQCHQLLQTLMP